MFSDLRRGQGPFIAKLTTVLTIAVAMLAGAPLAQAAPESDWGRFGREVEERGEQQRSEGLVYMASGAAVLIGSTIGFERSDDVLAKAVYSISQSLSIASIGYGAYQYSVGDDDRTFFNIIENSKSLSDAQKSEILRNYRERHAENARKERIIKIVTHSLIAGVNIYAASRESDNGLRTALYFFGGVNAVAAISIAF